VAAGSAPQKASLSDSGKKDDGAPRDGHYATRLPRLRAGALIGFYILARDSSGKVGRAPEAEDQEYYFEVEPKEPKTAQPGPACRLPHRHAPGPVGPLHEEPSKSGQPLSLYVHPVHRGRGSQPTERQGLLQLGDPLPRPELAEQPARGAHVLPGAPQLRELYDGRDRIILNAYEPFRQKAGGDMMRFAGVPVPDATVVRFKTPTFDDSRYVDVEVINNEFLDKKVGSSAGDVFRGYRGNPFGADLSYHGPDPTQYLKVYKRMNKKGDESIPQLLKMLEALDTKNDAEYVEKVPAVIDVQEWALYFAVNNILGNTEGGLSTGEADDYFIGERPSDGRFLLLPWDQDSTFRKADLELYPRRLPATPASWSTRGSRPSTIARSASSSTGRCRSRASERGLARLLGSSPRRSSTRSTRSSASGRPGSGSATPSLRRRPSRAKGSSPGWERGSS